MVMLGLFTLHAIELRGCFLFVRQFAREFERFELLLC
jgi:hypothetical protein